MRVAYVYDAIARIGGVERILVDKMNYLAEVYGYEVYFISSDQGIHPFSFPLSPKVIHVDLNIRQYLQYQYKYPKRLFIRWQKDKLFKRRLEEHLVKIDPDIICCTTYYKADVICKLKCKAKKIVESHTAKEYTNQNDGIKRPKILQWCHNYQLAKYNRIIEKHSDALVTLTLEDAALWKKQGYVFVIPNIIKKIPEQTNLCTAHRVISAGRLVHQKGYDRLIKAWIYVHQKHPDWALDIYGKGILYNDLYALIMKNKLEGSVQLCPPVSEITKEFFHSSIYVMSSNYEGFPMVLLEAMACGLPCISFDCPYGPSSIITSQSDGLIVENNNILKLAEAICFFIEHDNIRHQYGANAQKEVKRYLPENIMPKWKLLFEKL